jgi:hypothetical protein
MDDMSKSGKFLKNRVQQIYKAIYKDEVKKHCYKSLTQAGEKKLMIFGNNVKDIFRYYRDFTDMDWRAKMRVQFSIKPESCK